MTKEQVAEVMAELGPVTFNGLGFVYGPLRVEMGGGIAGKTNEWTITFPGYPEMEARGPFKSPARLRYALRELILWALKSALGMAQMANGVDTEKKS